MPAPKPAPPAPPPAPALRPNPVSVGRISPVAATKPTVNKPVFTPNGPSAPKPPVSNGIFFRSHLVTVGGITGAPAPQTGTGRKVPPPAPLTRPTGSRATAGKPPPPPAPKQATGRSQPNLAANLADMVDPL